MTKRRVLLAVLALVALIALANAHLLHVALSSQPDCVEHLGSGHGEAGGYRAAKSAC